jgi:hypothetical protein
MTDIDLRAVHSRITDNEADMELHSADIAALSASMQSLAKRLSVIEATLGIGDEDHAADVVVPGD